MSSICQKACQIRSPNVWLFWTPNSPNAAAVSQPLNFLSQPHSTPILGIGPVCYAVEEETNTEAHRGNAEDA